MEPPMTGLQKDKYLPMLFNYGSTYLTDYREPAQLPPTPARAPPPRARRPRPPYLRKDVHTLQYYRDYLPFNTMHRPKEIVGELPEYSANVPKIEVDLQRLAEVRRTRPRLVMTPALSLDDVTDPAARDVIVASVYRTAYRDLTRGAGGGGGREGERRRECSSLRPAPASPVPLPSYRPPVVPALWRRESAAWDRRQNRAHCDPDVAFWKHYPVYKWSVDTPTGMRCPSCHVTAQQEKKKREELLAN